MHVVAVAVEPEYVEFQMDPSGAATLTFQLARFEVTELANIKTGSIQLHLMRSDVENIKTVLNV